MKNLDAYHDGLLAAHLAKEDVRWTVECRYIVVDEYGCDDGGSYYTEQEAQARANDLNKGENDDD